MDKVGWRKALTGEGDGAPGLEALGQLQGEARTQALQGMKYAWLEVGRKKGECLRLVRQAERGKSRQGIGQKKIRAESV